LRATLEGELMYAVSKFALPGVISLCGTYLHLRLFLVSRKRRGEALDSLPATPDPGGLESRTPVIPSA
jgi:hypothetical protein